MTQRLSNLLSSQWQTGSGVGTPLFDPVLDTELVNVDATELDLAVDFAFSREQGGAAVPSRQAPVCCQRCLIRQAEHKKYNVRKN